MVGIPLLENKKVSMLRGVLVSCFCSVDGFLEVCFLFRHFKSAEFQNSFTVSWEILILHYQMFTPCFGIDTDPVFKFSQNLLDRSSGFVGARLFQHFQQIDF